MKFNIASTLLLVFRRFIPILALFISITFLSLSSCPIHLFAGVTDTDDTKTIIEMLFNIDNNVYNNSGTKIAPSYKRVNYKDSTRRIEDDTTRQNKIISLRPNGEIFQLKLELKDYDQRINISAYNMLGKKVLDIFNDKPYKDVDKAYDIPSYNLPNGVYFLYVQGENFKLAEKFYVSR